MNEMGSSDEICTDDAGKTEMSLVKNGPRKHGRRSKRKITNEIKTVSKDTDECQLFPELNANLFEVFSESKSSAEGEERGAERKEGTEEGSIVQRLRCRQHELNSYRSGIDRSDVTESRDLTLHTAGRGGEEKSENRNVLRRGCPGNRSSRSTCSEGSYSRRKHHKHKQKSKSPVPMKETPKINPIFLWVRQEDTMIMEVLCEDYDHRNRLRLRRTHHGWRAIPKTKRFAEATLANKPNKEEVDRDERLDKPKKIKKKKKFKKEKSKKKLKKTMLDNPSLIKECSVALFRDDSIMYKLDNLMGQQKRKQQDVEDISQGERSKMDGRSHENFCENLSSSEITESSVIDDGSPQSKGKTHGKTLTKSKSCEFSSKLMDKQIVPRSSSLDFNQNQNIAGWELENKMSDEVNVSDKSSDSTTHGEQDEKTVGESCQESVTINTEREGECEGEGEYEEEEEEELHNKTIKHSENIVMDMIKHDSDFNDADCDELGQLLNVIPDLEFVAEEELEEVDEDEWLTPTDLTLPKTAVDDNEKACGGGGVKVPLLPVNISPLITVMSSVKPPEPLTSPVPEVTITPIPKPAHQQKPQNNFLENLLASEQNVKPEREERPDTRKAKLVDSSERKSSKHGHGVESDIENKIKRLKCEDITLKSLLSKQTEPDKSAGLEKYANNPKSLNAEECAKPRLHELLTEKKQLDPISQLKEVLSNPLLPVPDPLLVPRARLPALVACPASEIPRLLTINIEKAAEKRTTPPVVDSDVLEVPLSNLQSLLSSAPDKLASANAQDLVNYQKSLETFLGWQRYQTELMERRLNKEGELNQNTYSKEMADMTATTAFSQMLWLPYLNQFDFNASRNLMSLMNSVFSDCKGGFTNLMAAPQINISQVHQPSPFLTPTSPMEIESHLKTLAMWQEALTLQQSSQGVRSCSKVPSNPSLEPSKRSNKTACDPMRKQFVGASHQKTPNGTSTTTRSEMANEYQRTYSSNYEQLSDHQRTREVQSRYMKPDCQSQVFKKTSRNSGQHHSDVQRHSRSNDRKECLAGSISVKPLSNLLEKNGFHCDKKFSWDHIEGESQKGSSEFTDQVALRLQQFNTQIQRTRIKVEEPVEKRGAKRNLLEAPKLKVKNLVDPNMSPPKLLKQMTPEHLSAIAADEGQNQTVQEGQNPRWHSLFGSNEMKAQPYSSPWRWTTVTVNGE